MVVSRTECARRMRQFAERCRRAEMKITRQRTEVFRELAGTDEHPDAETVYWRVSRRIAAISRDTVYRTLATLEKQGLVRRAETYTGAARYDANTAQHHHFVCSRCGRVCDFSSDALNDLPIPKAAAALGTITSAHVQVLGICRACQGRKTRSGRAR